VSRLLKAPAIAIVGPLSYSIYLTHQIIIAMVNNGVQIGATLISSCWQLGGGLFRQPLVDGRSAPGFHCRHDRCRLVRQQLD
jgi:hypothetical protein